MIPIDVLRVGISPYKDIDINCLKKYAETGERICKFGLEIELISMIAVIMNMNLNIVIASDKDAVGCGWDTSNDRNNNNTNIFLNHTTQNVSFWNGLLGMLERDEIDITGNLCLVEEQRVEAFAPSWPILQYRQGFLIRLPLPVYRFNITAPFQLKVWMGLILLAFVVCLLHAICVQPMQNLEIRGYGKVGSWLPRAWITSSIEWFQVTFGQYEKIDPNPILYWIVWIAAFGTFSQLYSTYITVALLNPVIKYRPFSDYSDLANSLLKGDYRLMDYYANEATRPQCDGEACDKLSRAINLHGYHRISDISDQDPYGLSNLLTEKENLVLARGMYWLELYLQAFDQRRMSLWLIEDEKSGENWSSFFYRKNARFRRRFDEAVVKIGDFKGRLKQYYVSMSKHVFREEKVRGSLPKKFQFTVEMFFNGPAICYAGGVIVAVMWFLVVELVIWKWNINNVKIRAETIVHRF